MKKKMEIFWMNQTLKMMKLLTIICKAHLTKAHRPMAIQEPKQAHTKRYDG